MSSDPLDPAPWRVEFLEAVRQLHARNPGRHAVGRDHHPAQEVVRFAAMRSLAFPASQIHDLKLARASGEPPTMTVALMGLHGPLGVLPVHYSELVLEESNLGGDSGPLAAFLDLFHHRLLSWLFRAWERNHPQLAPDPAVRATFQSFGLALAGRLDGPFHGPHPTEALERLDHLALWRQRRRPAESLRILLADLLASRIERETPAQIPIDVIPFSPRWIPIELGQRLVLSRAQPARLGACSVLGRRARDFQSSFRIALGPLSYNQFQELKPRPRGSGTALAAGSLHERLCQLVRRYVGPEFDFDVALTLRKEAVPRCLLSARNPANHLGRVWLTSRPPPQDLTIVTQPARPAHGAVHAP